MTLHFYADLVPVVSAHLHRLMPFFHVPDFKYYANVDILQSTTTEVWDDHPTNGHYLEALANGAYRKKDFKKAYQYQKESIARFKTHNVYMIDSANDKCHRFVAEAVKKAKSE